MKESVALKRRKFIVIGSQLLLIPLIGSGLNACGQFLGSEPVDWISLNQSNDHAGEILIESLKGTALVGNRALQEGKRIKNREVIQLKSGIVFASLPDGSVLKLSNQAIVEFDIDSKKGGIITLKKGGLLAAIRKSPRQPTLIKNASALVGIKGTVFYTQVLTDKDKQNPAIPKNASDYFCICNGTIDYLNQQWIPQKTSRGIHHNAYFLKPKSQNLDFQYANWLLNHSDDEILELINTMKGEKHKTNWLFGNGY